MWHRTALQWWWWQSCREEMRWWILFPGLLVALLSWDAISLSVAGSSGVKWSHYPPALLMLGFAPLQVRTGSHLLCWLCALAASTRTCLWQLMRSEWPGLISIWQFGKGINCLLFQCQFAATTSKKCTDLVSASPQLCVLPMLNGPRQLSWSLTPAMSWQWWVRWQYLRYWLRQLNFIAQGDCTCLDWSVCSEVRRGPLTSSSVIIKKLICVVLFFSEKIWSKMAQVLNA